MPLRPANPDKIKTIYLNGEDKSPNAAQRWWLIEDEDKIHTSIFSICDYILTNLAIRRRMNYFFAAIYNDTGAGFMASRNANLYYNRAALDGNAILNSRMSLNVLQNCIDTAASMIAKNKPKPQFLTDGSLDYATKVKGKRLTQYVEGVFDKMKIYEVMRKVFTDACIYGTGAIKLYEEDGEIKAENLFIEEILVDDLEGMHERPQQIHQRKFIHREVVAAMFPKEKEKVAAVHTTSSGLATFSTADLIPVIESWHLPSGPGAKDGMHTVCIENCTLLSEPYTKDYFPILFFRWAHQTLGFWGRGVCHEIWKLQRELDTILQTIQLAQRLVSGPIIAVESGSNIAEDHLTSNKLAKIIEYSVVPPQFLTPPIAQAELYEHAQYLEDRMYKVVGISQNNATGTKPPEVKSGVAIREVSDIASGRFELVGQRWEEIFLELARMTVDMSADLYKEDKSLSVLSANSKGAFRINFKDAITDLNNLKLQLFPISGLPSTPAGKLDQLMDYSQAGYLSKEQVMDIVDFPDLEDTVDLETAAYHLTQDILSEIKLEGKYTPPGPYLNLQTAYRMACLEVDRATLQRVEEKNIDLLRKWADAIQDLLQLQNQQQQQSAQQAQPQQQTGTPAQAGQQPQQG